LSMVRRAVPDPPGRCRSAQGGRWD
jgi:hypothetical protein